MTVPRIAVFTGDPAGIGPELVAKLLADSERCGRAKIVLIAQKKSIFTAQPCGVARMGRLACGCI